MGAMLVADKPRDIAVILRMVADEFAHRDIENQLDLRLPSNA